jgi:hypothetical protein
VRLNAGLLAGSQLYPEGAATGHFDKDAVENFSGYPNFALHCMLFMWLSVVGIRVLQKLYSYSFLRRVGHEAIRFRSFTFFPRR